MIPKEEGQVFGGRPGLGMLNLGCLLDIHIGRLSRKVETHLEFMGTAQTKMRNLGVICV